jgi:hypothetical protein
MVLFSIFSNYLTKWAGAVSGLGSFRDKTGHDKKNSEQIGGARNVLLR